MTLAHEPNERVGFKVHYEDEHLAVVEKPPGLVTTPGKGHEYDSLLNGLFARYGHTLQNVGADRDYGLLQRLDRDASGVLIVALTPSAWDGLRDAFKERRVRKFYWAVTRSTPNQPKGVIKRPIEEHFAKRDDKWVEGAKAYYSRVKLAKIAARGKPSLTAYRVLQHSDHGAFLECRAMTGRLHQVRVHLDSIGCSILGDRFYGPRASRGAAPRLMLHAHRVALTHPITGEEVDVSSRCPRDIARVLRQLGMTKPGVFDSKRPSPEDGDHEVAGDAIGEE
ncbi:MAG: RluA family pseudouridine synthase [Phycisphaerales bacterium JB058]